MSLKLLDSEIIDKLYKKYGFLDDEGFLVGTTHPNFLAVQDRVEQLARKQKLTPQEEREGAELVIIQKSYMKELRDYVLDQGVEEDQDQIDDDEEEEEDLDFEPNSEESESYESTYSDEDDE